MCALFPLIILTPLYNPNSLPLRWNGTDAAPWIRRGHSPGYGQPLFRNTRPSLDRAGHGDGRAFVYRGLGMDPYWSPNPMATSRYVIWCWGPPSNGAPIFFLAKVFSVRTPLWSLWPIDTLGAHSLQCSVASWCNLGSQMVTGLILIVFV